MPSGSPSRLHRCLLRSLVAGWALGTGLTFFLVSHAPLHREFDDAHWRAVVLPRVFRVAPWFYSGPIALALLVGFVAYRRGWEATTSEKWRKARLLLALMLVLM